MSKGGNVKKRDEWQGEEGHRVTVTVEVGGEDEAECAYKEK